MPEGRNPVGFLEKDAHPANLDSSLFFKGALPNDPVGGQAAGKGNKRREYPGQLARAVIKRLLLALALAMFNNYNGRRDRVGKSRPTKKETAWQKRQKRQKLRKR